MRHVLMTHTSASTWDGLANVRFKEDGFSSSTMDW
jgi:hypothetical protein